MMRHNVRWSNTRINVKAGLEGLIEVVVRMRNDNFPSVFNVMTSFKVTGAGVLISVHNPVTPNTLAVKKLIYEKSGVMLRQD